MWEEGQEESCQPRPKKMVEVKNKGREASLLGFCTEAAMYIGDTSSLTVCEQLGLREQVETTCWCYAAKQERQGEKALCTKCRE